MMQDTFQTLMDTLNEHERAIKAARIDGEKYDAAKRDYRIALASKIAELRFEKSYPVTLIPDLARGNEQVAALCYERDRLHTLSETDRFYCDYLKNKTWILQRQIEMEMKGR